MSDAVAALSELGFSDLEAAVYVALLERPDLTGYAVAQRIGKPNANTYKAIESLVRKGALMDDGGDPRCYRPVPADELLQRLAQEFSTRTSAAADALSRIGTAGPDDRVYQLHGDAAQVLQRARGMIETAQDVIVADVFPLPLAAIAGSLDQAAASGVAVFVRRYTPEPDGPAVHHVTREDPSLAAWPGQHLGLAIDAREHLFALFDREMAEIRQAVWSASPYLSCLAYNYIAMEWRLVAEREGYGAAEPPPLIGGKVSGYGRLLDVLDHAR